MSQVSSAVPAPFQGISQAPPSDRLLEACSDMVDCICTIPHGLQKRAPFAWGSQLVATGGLTTARFDDVPQGSPSSDITAMINTEGGHSKVRLFLTSTWASIPVTVTTAAQTYLDANAPQPKRDLRTMTVESNTFILNRTVKVVDAGATAATRPFEAMLWVKEGLFGCRFSVTVTPVGGSPVTAGFATALQAPSVSADSTNIAKALYDGTDPDVGHDGVTGSPLNTLVSQGLTVTLNGSLIYLSHPSIDFAITTSDGQGGAVLVAIKKSVQEFSDLPIVGLDGFVVRVLQESVGGSSDYYVQFHADASTTGGVWQECIAPGAPLGVDPTTLPVSIVNVGGTWTCDVLPWTGRTTGDALLSPDPDFIGEPIKAISWWKGRLVLVAPEDCTFSASDTPFKFYTTTLATALDSDPIGLLTPSASNAFFGDAIQFDQRFVTMGQGTQGIISALSPVITPTTTGMAPLSDADYTDQVPTLGMNHKVYFASFHMEDSDQPTAAIHEIQIDRLSGLAIPQIMTQAVPNLLPVTLDMATVDKATYMSFWGSSGLSDVFYRLSLETPDQEQPQNSWQRWKLPPGYTLAGMYAKYSTLFVLALSGGALVALTVDLMPDKGFTIQGSAIRHNLDLRITEAALAAPTYDGQNTTFTLPYGVSDGITASVRTATGTYPEAYLPPVKLFTSTTVTLQGDLRAVPLYFGFPYLSYTDLSEMMYRGQDGRPVMASRLTIQRIRFNANSMGAVSIVVSIQGRDPTTTVYQGYLLNDERSPSDSVPDMEDIPITVAVGGKSDKVRVRIENDTVVGFKITGYEWDGNLHLKSRRLT